MGLFMPAYCWMTADTFWLQQEMASYLDLSIQSRLIFKTLLLRMKSRNPADWPPARLQCQAYACSSWCCVSWGVVQSQFHYTVPCFSAYTDAIENQCFIQWEGRLIKVAEYYDKSRFHVLRFTNDGIVAGAIKPPHCFEVNRADFLHIYREPKWRINRMLALM